MLERQTIFQPLDICIEPVSYGAHALSNPQVQVRTEKLGLPVSKPVPRLGEHTAAVLAELGYTQTNLDDLAHDGIIKCG